MADVTEYPLVLVTGAGASRDFGLSGLKLPLMTEWSDILVRSLADSHVDFREATGLKPGMSGPEFEKALGQFLRNVEAFNRIEVFAPVTFRLSAGLGTLSESQLSTWYATARSQLDRMIDAIRGSLVDQFNHSKVYVEGAATAYRELLEILGIPDGAAIVYATTNYDPLGELALSRLGRRPDTGDSPVMPSIERGPLDIAKMLDGFPRNSPVFHLHGKVGWYRQPDGRVESRDVNIHDSSHGVPVVMLPDPEKTYADNDVLALLWAQFETALRRSTKTLVLGHSLNDALLVRALKEQIDDKKRLAITVLATENGDFDQAEFQRIKALFGDEPYYYPIHFGREIYGNVDGLRGWAANPLEAAVLPAPS
jgi:hypothetical protein